MTTTLPATTRPAIQGNSPLGMAGRRPFDDPATRGTIVPADRALQVTSLLLRTWERCYTVLHSRISAGTGLLSRSSGHPGGRRVAALHSAAPHDVGRTWGADGPFSWTIRPLSASRRGDMAGCRPLACPRSDRRLLALILIVPRRRGHHGA
jgi:hypothetical protein